MSGLSKWNPTMGALKDFCGRLYLFDELVLAVHFTTSESITHY